MTKLIFVIFYYAQTTEEQTISAICDRNAIISFLQYFNVRTAYICSHSPFFLCVISLLKNIVLNIYGVISEEGKV